MGLKQYKTNQMKASDIKTLIDLNKRLTGASFSLLDIIASDGKEAIKDDIKRMQLDLKDLQHRYEQIKENRLN